MSLVVLHSVQSQLSHRTAIFLALAYIATVNVFNIILVRLSVLLDVQKHMPHDDPAKSISLYSDQQRRHDLTLN